MHHPTARITHTPAFVTPVVKHWLEREIKFKSVSLKYLQFSLELLGEGGKEMFYIA